MGSKRREERRQKRESYASKRSQQSMKNKAIAAAILAGIVAVIGISVYNFINMDVNTPGAPEGAGALGDEHAHASLLVKIFGDKFDFSVPSYQIKSSWIHFENSDGNTVHRHATGVEMRYLFDSLSIGLDDQCYVFPDGRKFCTNEDYSLKFYVNHKQVDDIRNYVLQDDDRILISYGNETPDQIDEQLADLDSQQINK